MTAEPLTAPAYRSPTAALRIVPGCGHDPSDTQLLPRTHRFVQAVVEIVEGDRSPTQLLRWTSPRVYENVLRRARWRSRRPRSGPAGARARVVSVKVCRPADGVAEVAARVQHGARSHALAARLELIQDRWICTALEWG